MTAERIEAAASFLGLDRGKSQLLHEAAARERKGDFRTRLPAEGAAKLAAALQRMLPDMPEIDTEAWEEMLERFRAVLREQRDKKRKPGLEFTAERRVFRAFNKMSYALIERTARKAREYLLGSIGDTHRVNAMKVFEGLGRARISANGDSIPVTYHVEDLPGTVEAQSRFEPETGEIVVALDPHTYDDVRRDNSRARFTVLHEVGHALLHYRELISLALGFQRHGDDTDCAICENAEWQAEAFAAAFLVPAAGLDSIEKRYGTLYPGLVSITFGVSDAAAKTRLRVFGKKRRELLN
jgi:hypothetical protein